MLQRWATFMVAGHDVRRGALLRLRAGPRACWDCGSGSFGWLPRLGCDKTASNISLFSGRGSLTHACGGLCRCGLCCSRLCRTRLHPDALIRHGIAPEGRAVVVLVLRPRVCRRRRVLERLGLLRSVPPKAARNRRPLCCRQRGCRGVSCSLPRGILRPVAHGLRQQLQCTFLSLALLRHLEQEWALLR